MLIYLVLPLFQIVLIIATVNGQVRTEKAAIISLAGVTTLVRSDLSELANAPPARGVEPEHSIED